MSEALIIRLRQDPGAVQYLLVDSTGGRLGAVIVGPLSQAAPLAATRRVYVTVPAVDVISAQPELPAKNAARLAQLAPFAMEDLLATDIESMHFAVGKRSASGATPVVAVARERIESWLANLQAAGIEPDAIFSEAALLPTTPGGTTLIVDDSLLYVQPASGQGFALDAYPLPTAMRIALAREVNESDEASIVGDLQLYVTQSQYEAQESAFVEMREAWPGMQLKLLPEGPLPLFALETTRRDVVNLLSGPYERKRKLSSSFAKWRIAAALLGAAVALQLVYGGLRLWEATRTERELDKQLREIAAQTLPGVNANDTRELRRQFESRLGMMKQGGGKNELLNGLSALGEALAGASETRVEALSYRAQTIDLRVTAPSVDALDKIQQSMSASGLSARIQSATPRDNKVEGRLQLKL